MELKNTIRKLEFKKETITRLGGAEMNEIHGGTDGPGVSAAIENQCTLTLRTKGPNYTCNVIICKPTNS